MGVVVWAWGGGVVVVVVVWAGVGGGLISPAGRIAFRRWAKNTTLYLAASLPTYRHWCLGRLRGGGGGCGGGGGQAGCVFHVAIETSFAGSLLPSLVCARHWHRSVSRCGEQGVGGGGGGGAEIPSREKQAGGGGGGVGEWRRYCAGADYSPVSYNVCTHHVGRDKPTALQVRS